MSMQSTLSLLLIPLAILASDRPSIDRPRNYGTYESPNFEVPWSRLHYNSEGPRYLPDPESLFHKSDAFERMGDKPDPGMFPSPGRSETYSQSESLQVGPETHIPRQGRRQSFLDPMDLELMNIYDNLNANTADDRKIMCPQLDKDGYGMAQEKPIVDRRANQRPTGASKFLGKFFKTCPATTSRPVSRATTRRSTATTPASRSSMFCLPDPTPFSLATPKLPAPTTVRTTPKPPRPSPPPPPTSIPNASKVKPTKCRKKSSLTPKTAKIVLEIILATKQHALSVLKSLNYLEMEVLSQSAEDCPLEQFELGHSELKKKPLNVEKPLKPSSWKHSPLFSFGIRPASHWESLFNLAMARQEELKLQRRVWEEHKQQLRAMHSSKPKRFPMAPPAAVRLETVKEPRGPQEPLELAKRLKLPPNQDISGPEATWNPTFLTKAEMKAIQKVDTPEDALQTEKTNKDQRLKAVLFS